MGNSQTQQGPVDDYPGSEFQQKRRAEIRKKIDPNTSSVLTPLKEWRKNETMEEKEKRKQTYKAKEVVYWQDLPKWSDIGWKAEKHEYEPNEDINKLITIAKTNILGLDVDAIVNAANNGFLGGGGIDGINYSNNILKPVGAIHDAAGEELIMEVAGHNGLATGRAKITKGYNLPARYIIHTAGPTTENNNELISSYNTCLNVAMKNNVRSIAFCCISTGIFGFDLRKATHIALNTVRQCLEKKENRDKFDRIVFVTFLPKEQKMYNELTPIYFPLREPKGEMPKEEEKVEPKVQEKSEEVVTKRTTEAEEKPVESISSDDQIRDAPRAEDLEQTKLLHMVLPSQEEEQRPIPTPEELQPVVSTESNGLPEPASFEPDYEREPNVVDSQEVTLSKVIDENEGKSLENPVGETIVQNDNTSYQNVEGV